jgi:hypothetical protein
MKESAVYLPVEIVLSQKGLSSWPPCMCAVRGSTAANAAELLLESARLSGDVGGESGGARGMMGGSGVAAAAASAAALIAPLPRMLADEGVEGAVASAKSSSGRERAEEIGDSSSRMSTVAMPIERSAKAEEEEEACGGGCCACARTPHEIARLTRDGDGSGASAGAAAGGG